MKRETQAAGARADERGLQIIQKEAGNFELSAFPGLSVKEPYSRWPQRHLEGNAIHPPQ